MGCKLKPQRLAKVTIYQKITIKDQEFKNLIDTKNRTFAKTETLNLHKKNIITDP